MRKQNQVPSLLDEYLKLETLNRYNDPLKVLNERIDWESFRSPIESGFEVTDPSKGGRTPFDKVMLFKILIIQEIYDLSDDAMEFQIVDRWSFIRFLGLSMNEKVPDAKTIWLFRETLTTKGILENLFCGLSDTLKKLGLIVNSGKIIDATIMEVPKQRNTREENKIIKEGNNPEGWKENKSRQKDLDASWLKKNNHSYFGYKNHVLVDSKTKLIVDFQVTPANVSDGEIGQEMIETLKRGDKLHADRAYPSEKLSNLMADKEVDDAIMRKGSANHPISEEDKERNKEISKTRCRIEHVFGFQKRRHNKYDILVIGLQRATARITIKNMLYNMDRTTKSFYNMLPNAKLALI